MDDYNLMRRGHVPAFGSWDCEEVNQLPFTQCFESARVQAAAGLHLHHYAADDRDLYVVGDLYQNHVLTPAMIVVPHRSRTHMKEGKRKQEKWEKEREIGVKESPPPRRPTPKPVDEDLYKISPTLLYKPKKKRVFCLFLSCLMPVCV